MKTITAYYSCYNEEDWIEDSVRSIINHVDKIILVDGHFKFRKTRDKSKQLNPWSVNIEHESRHSKDKTIDILHRLKEEYGNKIKIVSDKLFECERDKRTYCINLCKGDFIFQVDGDEVYKSEELERLPELLDYMEDERLFAAKLPVITFFGNTNTIYKNGSCPVRIFQNTNDFIFDIQIDAPTSEKRGYSDRPRNAFIFLDLRIYHLSLIRKLIRLQNKYKNGIRQCKINNLSTENVDIIKDILIDRDYKLNDKYFLRYNKELPIDKDFKPSYEVPEKYYIDNEKFLAKSWKSFKAVGTYSKIENYSNGTIGYYLDL